MMCAHHFCVKKALLWKILLGTVLVLIPGSMLLLPIVVAAFHHRQRVSRSVELVQDAEAEGTSSLTEA